MNDDDDDGPNGPDAPAHDSLDLTQAVSRARSGYRKDVAALIALLGDGELYVPLARSVQGVPTGERVEIESELSLVPHMLVDEAGKLYCALFTRPELIEQVADRLDWSTDGEELEYCSVPANLALDMALDVIDEQNVLGLVINPTHDGELVLRREELGNIARGRAVPLVGYVSGIAQIEGEASLVAEAGDPPPQALVEALETALVGETEVAGYHLERTFNPERDLEPHLTLTLKTRRADLDHETISHRIASAIEDELPPPGYIDIVFEPLS
jgi:hypothetical protein